MKLTSYEDKSGRQSFGVVIGDATDPQGIVDLGDRYPTLRDLLADENGLAFARSRSADAPSVAWGDVRLLPVVPNPSKIFCIGVNYASHVKETGREMPTKPMLFARYAGSQVGHGAAMIRPKVSEQFDYEGELAVIIGKRSRYVSPEQAMERVAGYSCYNDGSVRDWQRHSQQFAPGKNFPKTGAFGPWMVTTDELPDISAQSLKTRLNGREVQSATLDDLIFDVAALVSYCSAFITLEPGDVIITGSPGGVGKKRVPPLFLQEGDRIEVEIEGIGRLSNVIAREAAAA